ncbi:hypothetical protein BHE90_001551 [Fusarium euwallaceae]|uniref:Amino acid permease/ SLC12A domain-containing protein n=2 Tax=Fusarium solani species complex TaxID=232080 RepID=A0A3M2RSF0_9HYPO|nr:hypothetical protein CDV36_012180 [Fusarium kuroshium]RTE83903.1 hypothetical protein BHE90_001551 [Fusarium euwallaceae]
MVDIHQVMEKDIETKGQGDVPQDVNFRAIAEGTSDLVYQNDQLERGLKSRHIQFLALGGAIGTGLFVGSGVTLSIVGPLPLFFGYIVMMLIVWNIMNNLAEMATLLPVKGVTVPYFIDRFVCPSLGFAAGWNYWMAYALLIGAEASAVAILFDYWNTDVHAAVWLTIYLVVILALNIIAVSFFGEAEFWFASIKLITILGLILTGLVIMLGGAPNGDRIGFRYWNNPGAVKTYLVHSNKNTGRFLAFWTGIIRAGFAYITSPELIAVAAGETIAPRRNIPKAAGRFVYRLAIFYGLGSLMIGIITPSNDPNLLNPESNANSSPWVIGIQNAGIGVLNHIINAAILTSAWSAGNALLYAGSRILYSLAINGQAPRFLRHTNRRGVPWVAILCTWSIGILSFLNVNNSGAKVFTWFMNLTTISGFIAWILIMITFIRFRKALEVQKLMHTLPYKTNLQPYTTYFMLVLLILLTLTNGFQVFFPGNFNASDFLAAYITLPIFLALYIGHKIYSRSLRFAYPVEEVDVTTGVKEMEELAALDERPEPKNIWQKIWFWIA